MSLIEGIGDEVTLLFGVGVILVIVVIAWISTSIQEIPFFSVIIVELTQRRRRRANANLPQDNEPTNSPTVNTTDTVTTEVSADSHTGTSPVLDTEHPSATSSSSNESNAQKSSDRAETEVETSVRFVNILENDQDGPIQTNVPVDIQVESQGHTEIHVDGQVEEPSIRERQDESQLIPDVQEDNLSETELRRRRVAFFEQKRTDVSDSVEDNLSHKRSPRADNSCVLTTSGRQDSESNDCDQIGAGCANITRSELGSPGASKSGENSVDDNHGINQSEERLNNTSQSEEEVIGTSKSEEKINTSTSQSEEELNSSTLPQQSNIEDVLLNDGQIRIRLKYLNDTQRNVIALPTDTVGQFRRANFAPEIADNKLVRFIFNGRDLRSDTMTLHSYNVVDNSVLHCLVTQINRDVPAPRVDTDGGFDMGTVMLPLFGVILCVLWYLRFEYRQFFSATSTISLFGITSLYVAAVLASWESHRRGNVHDHID